MARRGHEQARREARENQKTRVQLGRSCTEIVQGRARQGRVRSPDALGKRLRVNRRWTEAQAALRRWIGWQDYMLHAAWYVLGWTGFRRNNLTTCILPSSK